MTLDLSEHVAPKSDQTEQWRAVPGYEGVYEVSSLGRVRSIDRISAQGNRVRGRLLSPDAVRSRVGHLRVTLCASGKTQRFFVHRLVLLAFVGEPAPGLQGCHNDGNPRNNSLANLRWDTASANARDKVRHGRNDRANRTHCPRGHEYDAANTYFNRSRHRRCRTCTLQQQRASRRARAVA